MAPVKLNYDKIISSTQWFNLVIFLPSVLAVALELSYEVSALAVVFARLRFALVNVQLAELALVALETNAGGYFWMAGCPVNALLQLAKRLLAVKALKTFAAVTREIVSRLSS